MVFVVVGRLLRMVFRFIFLILSRVNDGIYWASATSMFDDEDDPTPPHLDEMYPEFKRLKTRSLAKLLGVPHDDWMGCEWTKVSNDAHLYRDVHQFDSDMQQIAFIYSTLDKEEKSMEAGLTEQQRRLRVEGLAKLKQMCSDTITSIQDRSNKSRELTLAHTLSELTCGGGSNNNNNNSVAATSDLFDTSLVHLHDTMVKRQSEVEREAILRKLYKDVLYTPVRRDDDDTAASGSPQPVVKECVEAI